jgi:hypothetical protein
MLKYFIDHGSVTITMATLLAGQLGDMSRNKEMPWAERFQANTPTTIEKMAQCPPYGAHTSYQGHMCFEGVITK